MHTACGLDCKRSHRGYTPQSHDWTKLITVQSKHFLNANEADQREMICYIHLGRIRFSKLLSRQWTPGPVLGLHSVSTFHGLLAIESQVTYSADLQ